MGLQINTNLDALNAHRNLSKSSDSLSKSIERLSSGLRINSAADDAAGLGISERMNAQIRSISQAKRNAQDGISLVQTADGALGQVTEILHRMRDLAVQYNNGVYDSASQAAITAEVAQLSAELERVIGTAKFNGVSLLTGPVSVDSILVTLQIGPDNTDTVGIPNPGIQGMTAASSFATVAPGSTVDLSLFDIDLNAVNHARTLMGSVQNRLEHTISYLGSYEENLMSAMSRIRDVDMAAEMTNMTRLQILQQAGTAMLSQANQAQSAVLRLLQG